MTRAELIARHPSTPDCDLSIRCAQRMRLKSDVREYHQRFEPVSAGLAFPEVPHAPWAQIFGPFRHEDRIAALSARIAKPRLDGFSGAGSEFHAAFSSVVASPSRRRQRIGNLQSLKQYR
jgi:hypothetical protein